MRTEGRDLQAPAHLPAGRDSPRIANAKTEKTLCIARGLVGSEKSKDEGISDHLQAA